ncbi:hypothetical protein GGR50DRAFT_642777 [Xylaria sp. CBS 124048]|nr:hypothetical protein GGR50DRAFT_642777 [Xylaria sp. CBS 124048]
MDNLEENVSFFSAVTGVESREVAEGYLQISMGDATRAIQTYYDNPTLLSHMAAASSGPAHSRSQRSGATTRRGRTTTAREDSNGVIHVDSDDDLVLPDEGSDADDVAAMARTAQEEEDAAMARRLQEELYGPGSALGPENDGVRAPIAQTTDTLAGPDAAWGNMMDPMYEEYHAHSIRQRQNRNPANPFSQAPSIWDNPSADPSLPRAQPEQDSTRRAALLRDLFRPPHELMSDAAWDEAREEGKDKKKWIMVNLQDMDIFQCQVLNRDLWKDATVQSLIREHFIFLQYEKRERRAQSYIQFYFTNDAHENSENYPHVSIIDPRTGEQVKIWSGVSFPNPREFAADLIEFLDRYSLEANSKNPVVKVKPKHRPVDLGRLTEDEMLQLAMQNSLDSNGGSSGSNVQDPDKLTKTNGTMGKGKGKATSEMEDLTTDSEESPQESVDDPALAAFSHISSTNPHDEPENNPAATTRIQFRHSAGRVIRRFAVADPVRRIYEWLKAEPFEGKEGIVFELKAMPAGSDLIGQLDKTIAEAGLKQGTVMIEFIEE